MSLILHCGANATDRAGLAALPPPRPLGARHHPIPFLHLVERVQDHFGSIGARLKDEAFGVLMSPGGAARRFFGLMEIELPDHRDSTYTLQVGLRSSYDQSISAGLAVGSRVTCCDNLALAGTVEFRTKNTTFIDHRVTGLIGQAVQRIPAMAENQSRFFDHLKNTTITQEQGDHLLIELTRRGALAPSQLGVAIREFDTPSYDEHGELGWTAWRLFNACTQAVKYPNSPNALGLTWARTQILTEFLDQDQDLHALPQAA
jgi:hypothetical protein